MAVDQEFNQRLWYFSLLILVLFLIFVGRLFYLQVIEVDKYRRLADGNRIQIREIKAPRGQIKTQEGKIIVSNRLAYSVSIIPDKTGQQLDSTLERLSQILEISSAKLRDKLDGKLDNKSVVLKRDISQKELVLLEEVKDELPGVIIDQIPVRDYLYDSFGSHLLGYVGEITAQQLKEYQDQGYKVNDVIGKSGLEWEYEEYLRGEDGKKQLEVNNLGQERQTLGVKQPQPGNDLILNIDFSLQQSVEKYLHKELKQLRAAAEDSEDMKEKPTGGVVVALDPMTGQVRALSSMPNFDLSLFSGGISHQNWQELNSNPQRPLLNRAIRSVPPPGSVFKLVTATAAVEELGISSEDEFYDPGYYRAGDVRFGNWMTGGHGELDFIDAIAYSNNTVFYKLGHQLYNQDQTLLQDYAYQYGFGELTDIDLPDERKGLVPGPKWRKQRFQNHIDQIWFPGYTINLSIGQGNLRTTPLQLANLVATVANGGTLYSPQVVDKVVSKEGDLVRDFKPQVLNQLSVSESTFDVLQKGMEGVTSYGTASSVLGDLDFKVAGKTGTAQTREDRNNHAWFAGYAPAEDPQLAIVVFLEYGNSSSKTLPLARKILTDYFNSQTDAADKEDNKE
ncbi:MAG: penicillin-binding protein 2 [Bacillota bacterium]